MGLAASQARFLGLTARKANCEFKSTQIAQERLQLSDQLSQISRDYANSMDATKLIWVNEACSQDYGVSYGLLMTPSAANDYNPYFITSKSGAMLLNGRYAAAAEAAGISPSGGYATQDGRDKFLAALIPQGLITQETANAISKADYTINENGEFTAASTPDSNYVNWELGAGMGQAPQNKTLYDPITLGDIISDKNIGKQKLDWLQIYKKLANTNSTVEYITQVEYERMKNNAETAFQKSLDNFLYANSDEDALFSSGINNKLKLTLTTSPMNESTLREDIFGKSGTTEDKEKGWIYKKYVDGVGYNAFNNFIVERLYNLYKAKNTDSTSERMYNDIKNGKVNTDTSTSPAQASMDTDLFHKYVITQEGKDPDNIFFANVWPNLSEDNKNKYIQQYQQLCSLSAAYVEKYMADNESSHVLQFAEYEIKDGKIESKTKENSTDYGVFLGSGSKYVFIEEMFDLNSDSTISTINDGEGYTEEYDGKNEQGKQNSTKLYNYSVIKNGSLVEDVYSIENMTIGDLLKSDIILFTDRKKGNQAVNDISAAGKAILEYVAKLLGYGSVGTGINIDETTNNALIKALAQTEKVYLSAKNAVSSKNGYSSETSDYTQENLDKYDTYINASEWNRIGTNENKEDAAVDLSNMVSAFLTYYNQYLTGDTSTYYVGKSSKSGEKNSFVTDDPDYVYAAISEDSMKFNEKLADFYNQLYNNLCAYGYRRDDLVDDNEYLQAAIKDGRYSIKALNQDGYFYQVRYADAGYLEEVPDEDARTRAEAQYTRKKSELTYKEDVLDMKTKNLDAEIAELTQEMNSVQNILQKAIEKTFQMFQGGS